MGAEKQSGECQVLASGGLACRCVGWLLPLVLKRPRLRLKIWNSWDGLGLGQTIVFGPWFLEPWGKDTQAEELGGWGGGRGLLRMAAVYWLVQRRFRAFLTSVAGRPAQGTAVASRPGAGGSNRPLVYSAC